jgi:hypothetical protein
MTHASTAHFPTDEAAELERNAYNAAFYELGFRWHWDGDTFATLQAFTKSCDRIRNYLESQHPHLLRAYDADFLANAIETKKDQCRKLMMNSSAVRSTYFNWAETRAAELGA